MNGPTGSDRIGDADLAALMVLAQQLRQAFEQRRPWPLAGLHSFPRGACGDTCRLVGEYLRQHGWGNWSYVSAHGSDPSHFSSHAWLTRDGVIIDLTADQFDDCNDPVIVSRTSEWHSTDRWPKQRVHTWGVGLDYYGADSGAPESFETLSLLLRSSDR